MIPFHHLAIKHIRGLTARKSNLLNGTMFNYQTKDNHEYDMCNNKSPKSITTFYIIGKPKIETIYISPST